VLFVTRPKYWNGLEATGFPFEMKVAEELKKANWDFLIDYPVSVLPDAANLPVEETAIDFKAWQDSLLALIEARRAAFCEWILFRKIEGRSFFTLSHHENARRRPGFEFQLRESEKRAQRSWLHSQSIIRFQIDCGVYSDVVSVNGQGRSKDGNEDQRANNSEVRKGAKQASIAAIGVMNDDFYYVEKAHDSISPPEERLYFPVITTAARLSALSISSDEISKDGIIENVDDIKREEVPWTAYRYSLPRSLWLPVFLPQNVMNDHNLLDRHRKLDIFIVNINHLGEFLEEIKGIVE
jgi:hypothetical protein